MHLGGQKTAKDLLSEIQFIGGYEDWNPITKPNKPGPKKQPVVAQAVLGGTEL